ncbi:MAG: type II toxin-antitoxin system VapC family toxin [Armatimonadetes bacterium]|nr:type II toxin-antitoxin system VapC family toxin [Armatimonadota bacterium]
MIGLDTNVLARYLVQDDPVQSAAATRLVEQECSNDSPGFVSHIVLCELVWVLESCYHQRRQEIRAVLERMLQVSQLEMEAAQLVWRALRDYGASRADFSDHLLARVNQERGCVETVTFDRKAGESAGFRLL